jgi:hypothetical protein
LVPNAQEISHLCDLGYEATITKAETPDLISQAAHLYDSKNLDMTLVDETWNSKVRFAEFTHSWINSLTRWVLTERNLCPYIEGCPGKSRCDAELDIQSSREAYRTRDSRWLFTLLY